MAASSTDQVQDIIKPGEIEKIEGITAALQDGTAAVVNFANAALRTEFKLLNGNDIKNLSELNETLNAASKNANDVKDALQGLVPVYEKASTASASLNKGLSENVKQQVVLRDLISEETEAISNQTRSIKILEDLYKSGKLSASEYSNQIKISNDIIDANSKTLAVNAQLQKKYQAEFIQATAYANQLTGATTKLTQAETENAMQAAIATEQLKRKEIAMRQAASASLGLSDAQIAAADKAFQKEIEANAKINESRLNRLAVSEAVFNKQLAAAELSEAKELASFVEMENKKVAAAEVANEKINAQNIVANNKTIANYTKGNSSDQSKLSKADERDDAKNIAFTRQLEMAERDEVIALNKHVDAANKAAIKNEQLSAKSEQAANAFTFMGRSVGQIYSQIGRMIISMTFSTVVIGDALLVIEKITSLYTDWRDGITEADKAMDASIDTIDKYNKKLDEHKKLLEDTNISYRVSKDASELTLLALKKQQELLESQRLSGKELLKDKSGQMDLEKQILQNKLDQIAAEEDLNKEHRKAIQPYTADEATRLKKQTQDDFAKKVEDENKVGNYNHGTLADFQSADPAGRYDPKRDPKSGQYASNEQYVRMLDVQSKNLQTDKTIANVNYANRLEQIQDAGKKTSSKDYEYQGDKALLEAKRKLAEDEAKIEIDKNKTIIESAISAAKDKIKAIQDNDKIELDEIHNNATYRIQEENALQDKLKRDKKIPKDDLAKLLEASNIRIQGIEETAQDQQVKRFNATQKQITEVLKKEIDTRYEIIRDGISRNEKETQSKLDVKANSDADTSFLQKIVGNSPITDAINNYNAKDASLNNQQEAARRNVATGNENIADLRSKNLPTKDAEQKLADDLATIDKISNDKTINLQDLKEAKEKALADQSINLAKNTTDAIQTIQDNAYNQQILNLENKSKLLQVTTQEEINAVQATTGFQVQKQQQLNQINAQSNAQQNQIQAQIKQQEIAKAKFDKEAAEAKVIESIAQGIAAIFPLYATDLPLAIALTALIAGSGAAQLAAVASTPIPQYKDGTENHLGGGFIAGDGGKHELITFPDGRSVISPDVATYYTGGAGTTVKPIDKILQQMNLISPVGMPPFVMSVNDNNNAAVENKLDSLNSNVETLIEVTARKKPVILKSIHKEWSGYKNQSI